MTLRILIAVTILIGGVLLALGFFDASGLQVGWRSEDQQQFTQAVARGELDIVREYLRAGMSPNTAAASGMPSLQLAIAANRPMVLPLLIEHGADLNAKWGPAQRTALHDAAIDGCLECVKILLKSGADPNTLNAFDRTPLNFVSDPPPPLTPPANVSEIAAVLREYGGN